VGVIAEEAVRIKADTSGFHSSVESGVMSSIKRVGITAAAALGGLAIGKALFADPIKSAGDFQQSLNVLQATSHATNAQMKLISATAMKLGADTKLPAVSATDAAHAMLELAKGGFSAKQSMDAARATLLLSTAAEVDGATAATMVADSIHAFGLRARDAGMVVNDFAGAANASTATMSDVALALQQSGQAFHQLGIPVGDATTAIAAMANAGIKGSDAGTSLKTMLQRLNPTTKQAKAEMQDMGVKTFDAQGNFVGMRSVIEQFAPKLADMTQKERQHALQVIFGSDAQRAASVILGQSAAAWDRQHAAVTRAGQAQKLADAQTKGFNGSMKALQSAVETLQLKIGLALLPRLTELVKWLGKIASAPNLHVAINIVWSGIKDFTANLTKAVGDALFGSSHVVHIGGHSTGVVIDPGLIAKIGDAISQGIKNTNWDATGQAIGEAISKAIKITTDAIDNAVTALLGAVNDNKDRIAEIGLVIGLTMLEKLTDPGFWAAHWQLIGGVALSVITVIFPEGKLAEVGLKAVGFLLKPFSLLGAKLFELGVVGTARFSEAISTNVSKLGGNIAQWIGTEVIRATSAVVAAFVKLGADLITAFINKVTTLNIVFRTALNTAVVAVIGNLVGAAVTAAGNLAAKIASSIMTVIQKLGPLPADLTRAVVDVLVSVGSKSATEAGKVASDIANAIKTAPAKLAGLGGDLVGRLVAIIQSVATSAYNAAVSLGSDMAKGVAVGIATAPWDLAKSAFGAAIGAVHAAGKAAARVKSPSGLTAEEIGIPLMQGIGVGIESAVPDTALKFVTSLNKIADAGVNATKASTPKLVAAFKEWGTQAKAAFDAEMDSLSAKLKSQLDKALAQVNAWKAKLTPAEIQLNAQKALEQANALQGALDKAWDAIKALPQKQADAMAALLKSQKEVMDGLAATATSTRDDAILAGNTYSKALATSTPGAQALVAAQANLNATKAAFDAGTATQADFVAAADALDAQLLANADNADAKQLLDQYNTYVAALAQQTAAGAAITKQQTDDATAQQALRDQQASETIDAQKTKDDALKAMLDANLESVAASERAARDKAAVELNKDLVARYNRIQDHLDNVRKTTDAHFAELARHANDGGANLIKAISQGIEDAKPTLIAALTSVATTIKNYLKVQSPTKEGPMSDLHKWWTKMGSTLVGGFDDHEIKSALTDAVTPQAAAGSGSLGPKRRSEQGGWDGAERWLERIHKEIKHGNQQGTGGTVVEVRPTGGVGIDASVYRSRR
jgi:TP901 family phage tail tape measure protein